MNLAEDTNYAGEFIVRDYLPGQSIRINQQNYTSSVILTPQHIIAWDPPALDQLTEQDLAPIFKHPAPLILWGSGANFSMAPTLMIEQCVQHNRVLEPMNTRAACGTFNMLLTDNRPTIAVLLL